MAKRILAQVVSQIKGLPLKTVGEPFQVFFSRKNRPGYYRWHARFVCSCGKQFDALIQNVHDGKTTSCGCLSRRRKIGIASVTHGLSKTRTYKIWAHMRKRCTDKKHNRYWSYGGRGIVVCQRWESFENFLADMGECPAGRSIDRINNDGNYEPSNCRWATYKQQNRNRSTNRILVIDGVALTIAEWAEKAGIPYHRVQLRANRGWTAKEAVYGK